VAVHYLAAALAQLDRAKEAFGTIQALRRTRPNATVASLLAWPNLRIRSEGTLDHIIEGLRKAGLPA